MVRNRYEESLIEKTTMQLRSRNSLLFTKWEHSRYYNLCGPTACLWILWPGRSILVDHGMEGGPVVLRAEGGVLSNNFNRTLWFLLNYLLFLWEERNHWLLLFPSSLGLLFLRFEERHQTLLRYYELEYGSGEVPRAHRWRAIGEPGGTKINEDRNS